MLRGCSKIRTSADAYCLYVPVGVRILLQRLGVAVVSTQMAQDVAALFISYSAGVRILLQRLGILWF